MHNIALIKEKIGAANFMEAIKALKSLTQDSSLFDEVIHIESRFNTNERTNRQGTLSAAEYNLECNKISKALLDVCSELEKGQKQVSKVLSGSFNQTPPTGYCIRTRKEIPFDLEKPFCKEAYEVWAQYEDKNYPENYCHFSGEPSHGKTKFAFPILKKNWDKAKKVHGF